MVEHGLTDNLCHFKTHIYLWQHGSANIFINDPSSDVR